MTILDARDVTDAERAAIADEPRPGVWVQNDPSYAGDGRTLDQHDTNRLIVTELHRAQGLFDQAELVEIVGWPVALKFEVGEGKRFAFEQRGGIHSDPLVRLLAFRAWGDRDRAWRKRDTAMAVAKAAAIEAERLRVAEIRYIASRAGLGDDWSRRLIDLGVSVNEARKAVFDD